MKNWFNNLKDKYKLLLVIGLYVGSVLFVSVELLCVVFLFFAILFTVFYVQYKKNIKKNETTPEIKKQDTTTVFNELSNADNQTVEPEEKTEIGGDFPKIYQNYLCRWQYRTNICFEENLDKLKLGDSDIDLVPEPDNQYDPNAVALYKGEYKLGYLYKGRIQEMVLSYLNKKDYEITVAVCMLDPENDKHKLAVKIGFYRNLETWKLESFTVPLVKITKKKDVLGSSRYENLSFCNVDDLCEVSGNDDGGYTVTNKYGEEIGDLPATTAKKIDDNCYEIMYAKIADIEESENNSYKVMISIFYQ